MMLMGPGISGNRVVGGTTHYQRPLSVHKNTLALSGEEVTDDAIRIKPAHIHQNIRQLLGIENSAASLEFDLQEENLSLLSDS
jgi:hypothetical protein